MKRKNTVEFYKTIECTKMEEVGPYGHGVHKRAIAVENQRLVSGYRFMSLLFRVSGFGFRVSVSGFRGQSLRV